MSKPQTVLKNACRHGEAYPRNIDSRTTKFLESFSRIADLRRCQLMFRPRMSADFADINTL